MPTQKSKKMILLKLDPQLYQDLKLVSQITSKSMTQIVKDGFADQVRKEAKEIRSKSSVTLVEHAKKMVFTGKIYYPELSSNELLYRLRKTDA